MKKIVFLAAIFFGLSLPGRSQDVATWVEQLAALREFETTVQQGYQTVRQGLSNIGDLRYQEYQLHSDYYGSLAVVNPRLQADPQMAEIFENLKKLIACLEFFLQQY